MLKNFLLSLFLIIFQYNLALAESFSEVNVNGNKRISKNSIIVFGDIKMNKDYNDKELNNVLKNLYQTDFFKDINLNISNNILNIEIIENPIIENLNIVGLKNKKLLEFVEESMDLKSRKSFSKSKVRQDLSKIKKITKSAGYYFTDATSSFTVNEDQNSVQLTYNVNLGKKAKIKKIMFLGEKKFKNKKLRQIISSEEHKFWKFISRKVYLNPEQIEFDKRLLSNHYKNNGYYNSKIENSFVELDADGNFNLIFNINSGEKFYFNKFSLNIPQDFDPLVFEPMNKIFLKLENKSYSLDKINSIIDEVDKIAVSRQYDFIDATIDEEIIGNNKINFNITVQESEKFYVDKINILGNFNTIEEVIRHQLIIDEGDAFNKILFNKSVNKIRSLGIFKTVKTEIIDNSKEKLKTVNIEVEEKPTGEISLGAGLGTSGGTIGGGIKENNFLGKGINLDTNITLSADGIKGRFVYARPNFNYTDNTLYTSILAENKDKLSINGYKTSNIGMSIGTSYERYENLFFSPTFDLAIETLETSSAASAQLKKQKGDYLDLYFNYGLDYDLRDNGYQPTDGYKAGFNQSLPISSENYEISNSFEISKYQVISKSANMIGKIKFNVSSVNALSNDVRISKRLFMSANDLRGFKAGKIGPFGLAGHVGGNYITSVNLVTSLPTVFPTFENIDFSIFLDAANVWGVDYNDSALKQKDGKIRSSAGIAMDIGTPVGPLSFSFSQVLTKASTDITESFRFNLGTTF